MRRAVADAHAELSVDLVIFVCFGTMLPSDFGLFNLNFSVLLLLLTLGGVQAVCPYCFGNFASCTYDNDQKCPAVEVPAANALVGWSWRRVPVHFR